MLTGGHLERVTCPYVAMSLKLQREFGMRREEAMKIQPQWADKGNRLVLKDTWCKGKRERVLFIRTASQRAVLDEAKALAATTEQGSLIPTRSTSSRSSASSTSVARRASMVRTACGTNTPSAGSWNWPICLSAGRWAEAPGHDAGDAKGRPRRPLRITRELGHGRRSILTTYCG